MPQSTISWELALIEQLTHEAYSGTTTKSLLRTPFGAQRHRGQIANGQGYHTSGWTVDSRDRDDGIAAQLIYERFAIPACSGAIITFGDINPANSVGLPRLLEFFESDGYQFVTVSEMLSP